MLRLAHVVLVLLLFGWHTKGIAFHQGLVSLFLSVLLVVVVVVLLLLLVAVVVLVVVVAVVVLVQVLSLFLLSQSYDEMILMAVASLQLELAAS